MMRAAERDGGSTKGNECAVDDRRAEPNRLQDLPLGLFENSPLGIACLDPGGIVVECNDAFASILGHEAATLSGAALTALIADDDRDDVASLLAKLTMQACRNGTLEDVRVGHAAGGERTATLFAASIERDGSIAGLLVHMIETTARRAAQAESAHAQRLQALGRLTGGIAHDFNTLIAAMLGCSELLLGRHAPGDPAREELEHIRASALRARELVGQLLTFVRRQPLQPGRLHVDRAIDALVPMLRRLLGASITIETQHREDPGALPTVRLDAGQFDQVILNLAVNAREAMPEGGQLDLRTRLEVHRAAVNCDRVCLPAGRYVVIEVADTGCGIPQDIVDRIFEPFFTTRQEGQGTGLGLANVLDIVRASGGAVSVRSAPQEGTCFRILLPALTASGEAGPLSRSSLAQTSLAPTSLAQVAATLPEPPVAVPAMPVAGSAVPMGAAQRILLVDDEAVIRRSAARALRGRGYEVVEAADGEEALDALSSSQAKVDLLLTDLMLPGTDGRAVIERALTVRPELRAIVISAQLPEGAWRAAGVQGDDRVFLLPKPFTLAELAAAVKKALDR